MNMLRNMSMRADVDLRLRTGISTIIPWEWEDSRGTRMLTGRGEPMLSAAWPGEKKLVSEL